MQDLQGTEYRISTFILIEHFFAWSEKENLNGLELEYGVNTQFIHLHETGRE